MRPAIGSRHRLRERGDAPEGVSPSATSVRGAGSRRWMRRDSATARTTVSARPASVVIPGMSLRGGASPVHSGMRRTSLSCGKEPDVTCGIPMTVVWPE